MHLLERPGGDVSGFCVAVWVMFSFTDIMFLWLGPFFHMCHT
jgi:hypothetical protein